MPPAFRARVRDLILDQLRQGAVPGCTIAVVDDAGVSTCEGFGVADLGSGRTAAPDTVYHLFSGTKLFTATAVMQLIEQGRISLDDPIGEHVPSAAHLTGVSVRHLLSHTSGLKDSLKAFIAAVISPETAPDAEHALGTYALVATHAPDIGRVSYRNVNYALLGALISRVGGAEYRDVVRARVLGPLGLDCDFAMRDAWLQRAATGHIDWFDPMRAVLRLLHPDIAHRLYRTRYGRHLALVDYGPSTSAIGGLVGTVPEFAAFLMAHLVADPRLLTKASYAEMHAQYGRGAAGIESRVGTGLGWKVGRVGGVPFLNHEGGGPGFTSELRLYPEQGIGVALAMNAMRMPGTMRVAHRIAEIVRRELTAP